MTQKTKIDSENQESEQTSSDSSSQETESSSKSSQDPLDVLVEEEPEVGELIKKKPEVERILRENPQIIGKLLQVTTQTHFSGPLPPPDIMKGYEDICPGAARDILDMAKTDAEHLRSMQKGALLGHTIESILGIISGLIIALTTIAAITYCAISGQPITAGVVGSVAVVAGVFMKKKASRPKVKVRKAEESNTTPETE
ncbi:DUF2335 domain-containing protein [Vibrio fluvialis]|nr:DUF2335 domain-containing protein [Vibrio fluvialis]ELP2652386.1 DUF2335 domain-containing protein [Vibrio fluvialis]